MNLWQSMQGMLSVELTCADPEEFMHIMNTYGIHLFRIEMCDTLTFRCHILRSDYRIVSSLCKKFGNTLKIISRSGMYWNFKRLSKRPVLAAGLALMVILILFIPTRIYFFSVEGNTNISDQKILEAAENCGMRFGVSRRAIRSEKMKNALLAAIPQLQWAGINTSGCNAIISVKERDQSNQAEEKNIITKMVAVRDGIITSCTVTKGNAVCTVGESVQKGQQLISPYVDCGIAIKVSPVAGEIFGQTHHKIQGITPKKWMRVQQSGRAVRRYYMIIGKKRINLWKGSGISDTICGRMYEEYCITLPGGFQLPVSMGVETVRPRKFSSAEVSEETADTLLRRFSSEYVCRQMIAGTILTENAVMKNGAGIWYLDASYVCEEMIGRIVAERNGEMNE